MTAHLLDDGTGEITPHRVNEGGEYLPAFALSLGGLSHFNVPLAPKLDDDGQPLPRRLVGMTMTNCGNGTFGLIAAWRNIQEPCKSEWDRAAKMEPPRF